MLRLAFRTAFIVATVLLLPDLIAISPSCSSIAVLCVRAIGLWLSVWIQWFLSFLLILISASFLQRGVLLGEGGIQLSRFSKPIGWERIVAAQDEPNLLISRILFLRKPARRLTLMVQSEDGRCCMRHLDSLCFSSDEFDRLKHLICERSFVFQLDR